MASAPSSHPASPPKRGKQRKWRLALSLSMAAIVASAVLVNFFLLGPLLRAQLKAAGLRDVRVTDAGLTLNGRLAIGRLEAVLPGNGIAISARGLRLAPVHGSRGWRVAIAGKRAVVTLPLSPAAEPAAQAAADATAVTARALLSVPVDRLLFEGTTLRTDGDASVTIAPLQLSRSGENAMQLTADNIEASGYGGSARARLRGSLGDTGMSATLDLEAARYASGPIKTGEGSGELSVTAPPTDLTAFRLAAQLTLPAVAIGEDTALGGFSLAAEYAPDAVRLRAEALDAAPSLALEATWQASQGWRAQGRLSLARLERWLRAFGITDIGGQAELNAALPTAAPFRLPRLEQGRGEIAVSLTDTRLRLEGGTTLSVNEGGIVAELDESTMRLRMAPAIRGEAVSSKPDGLPRTAFQLALEGPLEARFDQDFNRPDNITIPAMSAVLRAPEAESTLRLTGMAFTESFTGLDGALAFSAQGRLGDYAAESLSFRAPLSVAWQDSQSLRIGCANGIATALTVDAALPPVSAAVECLSGAVTPRDDAVSIAGEVADLRLEQSGAARFRSGPVSFEGSADGQIRAALESGKLTSLAKPRLFAPLSIAAKLSGNQATGFDFTAQASNATGDFVLQLEGQHQGDGGTAQVTLFPVSFFPEFFDVGALSPAMGRLISGASGTLEGGGTLGWGSASTQTKLLLRTDDFAFTAQGARLSGIETDFAFNGLLPPTTPSPQSLRIAEIASVVPITGIRAELGLTAAPALVIAGARATMAGGRIDVERTAVQLSPPINSTLRIRAKGVDLATLINLLDVQGLQAEGTLEGELPLRIEDGDIRFSDAALAAAAQGTLRYSPDDPPAFLKGTDQRAKLLRQALQNFRYDRLTLTLDGPLGGDQVLRLGVGGSNPDFFDGRPVNLNVNITGPLDSVLRQTEASISGQGISLDTINALPKEKPEDADSQ